MGFICLGVGVVFLLWVRGFLYACVLVVGLFFLGGIGWVFLLLFWFDDQLWFFFPNRLKCCVQAFSYYGERFTTTIHILIKII